jgi:Replication protein.
MRSNPNRQEDSILDVNKVNGFSRETNNSEGFRPSDDLTSSLDLKEISSQFLNKEDYSVQSVSWYLERTFKLDKLSNRFRFCKQKFLVLECANCGEERVAVPNSCNVRICEKCLLKAFMKLKKKYSPIVKKMRKPKFMTLTWENVPILTSKVLDKIHKDVSNFLRRKGIKEHVRGGIYALEVTHKGNGWNIHVHFLIDMDYIDQKRISEIWLKVTKNSPIIDIRSIYLKKNGRKIPYNRLNNEGDRNRAKLSALNYVLGYMKKKPDLMNNYQFAMYIWACFNRHLIHSFGSFYGVTLPISEGFTLICSNCGSCDWIPFLYWIGDKEGFERYKSILWDYELLEIANLRILGYS